MEPIPQVVPTAIITAGLIGKPFADQGAQLLGKLLGAPVEELGKLLGDSVSEWRRTNALMTCATAYEKLRSTQRDGKQLPNSFVIPLISAASHVDDDLLRDIFASLIAEAASDKVDLSPLFALTLQSLSHDDARLLLRLHELVHKNNENWYHVSHVSPRIRASFDRLHALRLVAGDYKQADVFGEPGQLLSGADDLWGPIEQDPEGPVVMFSGYGRQFMAAVGRPVTVRDTVFGEDIDDDLSYEGPGDLDDEDFENESR